MTGQRSLEALFDIVSEEGVAAHPVVGKGIADRLRRLTENRRLRRAGYGGHERQLGTEKCHQQLP